MKKAIFVAILIFLILSCAVQAKGKKEMGKKPAWLENPKSKYPEQLYLTAIGDGDSRNDAENMAAANLSKIFESKIKAEETTKQRYRELTVSKKTSTEDEMSIEKNVNILSEQTLYNIQFADSYTNELGRVYTLAYLKRMETGEIYEEKINKNSEQILHFTTQSKKATDILRKYSAMNAASVVALNNNILLDQLSIISPDTKEFLELHYDYNNIVKETAELAKQVGFSVTIRNDPDNKIGIAVESMLTDLGFVISNNGVLNIKSDVMFENTDLKRDDDFKFVRYNFNLNIENRAGDTIVSLAEKGKEGHTTHFEARERAIRTIGEKINKSLKKKLIAYFDGLVK
ncbi:MAG: LPP20 family lipoprotein [Candidatus Cloacimonetes bacterium]|nr:LPP20 family lipoprotein [Candidatus Cloacimonadota bacterium]